MSKRRGSQHKKRASGGARRTVSERALFETVIAERLKEVGFDPPIPSNVDDLNENMKAIIDDYNYRVALIPRDQIDPYAHAWEAFGNACLEVNERAQMAAIEDMRAINPASPTTSAFAVAARLTFAIHPLGNKSSERKTIRAMAATLAEYLDVGGDESEVILYSAVLSAARSGESTTPVIASYGGEIVMNRLRLLIAMMLRGQVAEGRDQADAIAEIVEVAVQSVVEHF